MSLLWLLKRWLVVLKRIFQFFFDYEYKCVGRRKKYFDDELLGFVIYAISDRKLSCREMSEWTYHNDNRVNYLLNFKTPSKSLINNFILEKSWLIEAFFVYIVRFGVDNDLIDGECVFNDGTIFKADANKFRLIKIEEIEFIENLIKDYGFDNSKNSIWYKLSKILL